MSPKEYLSQLRRLAVLIDLKNSEKEELRRAMSGLSGIDYSQDRVQVSPTPGATFERTVDKIEAMEREIDKLIDRYVDLRRQIIGQIELLPDERHVKLLYKHYAEFKTLARVAGEMHYSYEHLRRIHNAALSAFEKRWMQKDVV